MLKTTQIAAWSAASRAPQASAVLLMLLSGPRADARVITRIQPPQLNPSQEPVCCSGAVLTSGSELPHPCPWPALLHPASASPQRGAPTRAADGALNRGSASSNSLDEQQPWQALHPGKSARRLPRCYRSGPRRRRLPRCRFRHMLCASSLLCMNSCICRSMHASWCAVIGGAGGQVCNTRYTIPKDENMAHLCIKASLDPRAEDRTQRHIARVAHARMDLSTTMPRTSEAAAPLAPAAFAFGTVAARGLPLPLPRPGGVHARFWQMPRARQVQDDWAEGADLALAGGSAQPSRRSSVGAVALRS